MNRKEKILGGLLGGALGDAMGAPTETRTPRLIQERFGGYVTELIQSPMDTFARGAQAGFVTDDFSLAYFTAQEIAKSGGAITDQVALDSLLTWSSHPEFFDNYAGPTTRAAVNALRGELVAKPDFVPACDNSKATNGSAMKIAPVGFLTPGDLDKTIEHVFTICKPSHFNNLSLSGACAVACAVSRAMEDGTKTEDVIEAGLYGARRGMELAASAGAVELAGPSVEKRIPLAVEIGKKHAGNWEQAMLEIADVIGAGLHVSEAVPAVFGCLAATDADPMQCIYMGVNIGNDTDTIATMAGAVAGTLRGAGAIPRHYLEQIDRINSFDLEKLTDALCACVK